VKQQSFDHSLLVTLSTLDSDSCREQWREILCKKLGRGGELTKRERMVLLELLKPKKRSPGQVAKSFERFAVNAYVANLEDQGWSTEAAVAAAAKKFDIKRSTIFTAKTRRRPKSK
jgi:hypothetical protein